MVQTTDSRQQRQRGRGGLGSRAWTTGRGREQKLVQERERDYRGTHRSVCVIYMRRRHCQRNEEREGWYHKNGRRVEETHCCRVNEQAYV